MIHNVKLRDQSGESDKLIELKVQVRDWDIQVFHGDDLLVAVEYWGKLRAIVWENGDEGQNGEPVHIQEYDLTNNATNDNDN